MNLLYILYHVTGLTNGLGVVKVVNDVLFLWPVVAVRSCVAPPLLGCDWPWSLLM